MEKQKIVVATGNSGKLKEIKEIFSEFKIISMKDLNINIDTIEDQDTFSGNALKKATELSTELKCSCIADDSGIEIPVLNGFPGVRTKRWLDGTDRDRNLGILEKMKNINNRKINFITAIALVDTTKNISISKEHIISGNIPYEIRGENGFGFDEIFELENGKTIAELSSNEKNNLSPRKMALEEIKKFLINK